MRSFERSPLQPDALGQLALRYRASVDVELSTLASCLLHARMLLPL